MKNKERIALKKEEMRAATREAEETLFREFQKTKNNSQELAEQALLVSGSVVMGFIFIQLFLNRKRGAEPPKMKTSAIQMAGFSVGNRVYKRFLQYLATFLLGMARKKLVRFLTGNEHEVIDNTEGSV